MSQWVTDMRRLWSDLGLIIRHNICNQIPTSQHSKSCEDVGPHLVIRTTTKSAKLFVWKSTSLQNNLYLSLSLSLFEPLLPNTDCTGCLVSAQDPSVVQSAKESAVWISSILCTWILRNNHIPRPADRTSWVRTLLLVCSDQVQGTGFGHAPRFHLSSSWFYGLWYFITNFFFEKRWFHI